MLVPVATGGLRAVMPKLLIFDGEKGTVFDSCAPQNIFRCTECAVVSVHYDEIYLLSHVVWVQVGSAQCCQLIDFYQLIGRLNVAAEERCWFLLLQPHTPAHLQSCVRFY